MTLVATDADVLYAKRPTRGRSVPTVYQHGADVASAARAIMAAIRTPLRETFGLSEEEVTRLERLLQIAALLHDIGKANSAFQDMLLGRLGERRQPVRHEVLGAILCFQDEVWGRWFKSVFAEEDYWTVCWAVAGHHLKVSRHTQESLFRVANTPAYLSISLGSADVRQLLLAVFAAAGKPVARPPEIGDLKFDLDESTLALSIDAFVAESASAWRRLKDAETFRRDLALLKALLISADVAGSALPAKGEPIERWIDQSLSLDLDAAAANRVVESRLAGKRPHRFQEEVAVSESTVTLVLAGCGNGKTTAAYMWARRQAMGRKLFFAYPTTGTASAGFDDYLVGVDEIEAALMHSRSTVDLEEMLDVPEAAREEAAKEVVDRLQSMRAWDRQAIVCTTDAVLGLVQNQRRSLFSFPSLAKGAFVFDEIHSYDARLFEALLSFLATFKNAPVLLMTASLPPSRMKALRECLGDRLPGRPITGEPTLERLERYRITWRDTKEMCVEECEQALARGEKVLWVCNTVSEAIMTYDRLAPVAEMLKARTFLFHSRFRYEDRMVLQKNLLRAFDGNGPLLAVTTQICEMSLNISSETLISASCPFPALIQRLGRLNRFATQSDPRPAYLYPFQGRPYDEPEDVFLREEGEKLIRAQAGSPLSQHDLARALDGMEWTGGDADLFRHHAWLDGGWESEPLPLRGGDSSVTLVRAEDIPSPLDDTQLIRRTIPMPIHRKIQAYERIGGYLIAPAGSIHYCPERGATWAD